jgi:hypothetical protein
VRIDSPRAAAAARYEQRSAPQFDCSAVISRASGQPRPRFHRLCRQHRDWPSPVGRPPTPLAWQCDTAWLMPSHSSLQRRLVTFHQQDNAAPSLHSHYKNFHTSMGGSASCSGLGILPHGVSHLSFPLSSGARFSRSIPKPVLSSCRLYTDCRRARKQVSSRLVPEHLVDPGFDSAL